MSRNYELHLNTARDYFNEGNYEATRMAAQHAIEAALSDEGYEAKALLAMALRKLEYHDEAFRLFGELMLSEPSPEVCATYALMRAERRMSDDTCREAAERAIQENPDLGDAYLALFWYNAEHANYLEALSYLKRGIHRDAEFPEHRAFTLVHDWCQQACNEEDFSTAYAISNEIVDVFGTCDFLLLHARLADAADDPRTSVKYYKRALAFLRPGPMRTSVLEAIAKIAI